MKTIKRLIIALVILGSGNSLFSQEIEHEVKEESEVSAKFEKHHQESEEETHHSVSFMIGHAHISTAVKDGKDNEWLTIPAFALHYIYKFNEKWGLGLHTEILLEDFEIAGSKSLENGGEPEIETIERNRPVAVALMGYYELHHHLILMLGGGAEFSSKENFALIRLGVDIPIVERFGWEAFGTFIYDINIDAYNSFNLGFGIAKNF